MPCLTDMIIFFENKNCLFKVEISFALLNLSLKIYFGFVVSMLSNTEKQFYVYKVKIENKSIAQVKPIIIMIITVLY